jgi:hypothetical protein
MSTGTWVDPEADTVIIRIPRQAGPPAAREPRLRRWWRAHWSGFALLTPALLFAGAVTGWNLQGWPGRIDDDEGTYVAEAWAMLYEHHLSHYTYWYDHPPLGWAQIAAFGWLTDGFHRVYSDVMLGRQFMWCLTLVACVLLYVFCRRLGLRRVTGCAAVVLFAASPLALMYHRMVSLDNIGTVWLLAALAIAASRRQSLGAAFWSAAALAIGILSKETIVILAPAVVWVLWQHTSRRTRRWHLGIFGVTLALLLAGYPLFAALRDELMPGHGHVSLLRSLWWQFFARSGSGDPLAPGSMSNWMVHVWLGVDPWLAGAGMAVMIPALWVRRLRPAAIGLLIQVLVPFKGSYLPYFYVTSVLPFAAICVAGAFEVLWLRSGGRRARRVSQGAAVAAAVALTAAAGPQWWGELSAQSRIAGDSSSLAATRWVEKNLPRDATVVTDDYIWPDLKTHGMNPLWEWKVDGDPHVNAVTLPQGWKSVQFVVLTPESAESLTQMPTLARAVSHSIVLKDFGQGITLREVLPGPLTRAATAAALNPAPPVSPLPPFPFRLTG